MASRRLFVNDSPLRGLLIPVRWRTGKAPPAKITYKERRCILDEDSALFRSRLNDSTIEAANIMKKSPEFSKDDRITVPEKDDTSMLSGLPEEQRLNRRARIFIPTKSATQSGTYGTRCWRIEFDNCERWENPLMGWASTGDPLSNLAVEFATAEDAETFCQRQGWNYYIDTPHTTKMRVKSYGANFSWNRRTRVQSK